MSVWKLTCSQSELVFIKIFENNETCSCLISYSSFFLFFFFPPFCLSFCLLAVCLYSQILHYTHIFWDIPINKCRKWKQKIKWRKKTHTNDSLNVCVKIDKFDKKKCGFMRILFCRSFSLFVGDFFFYSFLCPFVCVPSMVLCVLLKL